MYRDLTINIKDTDGIDGMVIKIFMNITVNCQQDVDICACGCVFKLFDDAHVRSYFFFFSFLLFVNLTLIYLVFLLTC